MKNGEKMVTLSLTHFGLIALTAAVVLLTGFLLLRGGKPYSTGIFTIHKLAALAGLVGLVLFIRQALPSAPIPWILILTITLLAVGFILTFVSGGIISAVQKAPTLVRILHPIGVGLIVLGVPALLVWLDKAGYLKASF
jgi:hypothetical protein